MRTPTKIQEILKKNAQNFAEQSIQMGGRKKILNTFNSRKAAIKTINFLKQNFNSENELNWIRENERALSNENDKAEIEKYYDKHFILYYFSFVKGISYQEAQSLLIDKGCDFYEETIGYKNELYIGKYKNDYPATVHQIQYIRDMGKEIKNETELSAREAGLIIKCLKNKKRTKPHFFSYYIL